MKKQIMKRAWEMYKVAGCSSRAEFGLALKAAWAEAKTQVSFAEKLCGFKSWFVDKNFSQGERYVIECAVAGGEYKVKKETEKAVMVRFESDYGSIVRWFPKSVCVVA